MFELIKLWTLGRTLNSRDPPSAYSAVKDLGRVGGPRAVEVLKELFASSEEISWAKLERREPVLVPWFGDHEKRRLAAERVGVELHRRGGRSLLEKLLETELGQYPAIRNGWSGLE